MRSWGVFRSWMFLWSPISILALPHIQWTGGQAVFLMPGVLVSRRWSPSQIIDWAESPDTSPRLPLTAGLAAACWQPLPALSSSILASDWPSCLNKGLWLAAWVSDTLTGPHIHWSRRPADTEHRESVSPTFNSGPNVEHEQWTLWTNKILVSGLWQPLGNFICSELISFTIPPRAPESPGRAICWGNSGTDPALGTELALHCTQNER